MRSHKGALMSGRRWRCWNCLLLCVTSSPTPDYMSTPDHWAVYHKNVWNFGGTHRGVFRESALLFKLPFYLYNLLSCWPYWWQSNQIYTCVYIYNITYSLLSTPCLLVKRLGGAAQVDHPELSSSKPIRARSWHGSYLKMLSGIKGSGGVLTTKM